MKLSKLFTSGVFIAIVGIVLFSAKAVMVKLAYRYEVSSLHLLLFRMLFSVPFYIVIAILFKAKQKEKRTGREYAFVVLFGVVGYYLASYFDFLGLQYVKAGYERIILFIYPTLVIIISRIFLKKRIQSNQIIAIIITYFGIVITFWGELNTNVNHIVFGSFLVFMSALTYAIYLVGSGWLIPKFGVVLFTSYAMISATVFVCLQYLALDRSSILNYGYEVYLLSFLMAIFSTLIPSFLVSLAIKKLNASNFSIIGSIGPISTIILAYFFLDEQLHLIQIIGAVVVIIGITIVSFSKREKV